MLYQSSPRKSISRIAQEVHFNPGASATFIREATGFSENTIAAALKRMEFEHINAPVEIRSGDALASSIYVVSKLGAKNLIGRYRDPLTLAQAVAMNYFRLSALRVFAGQLFASGNIEWMISPWRPRRSLRYAAALMCWRDTKATGHLKLIHFPSGTDAAEDIRNAVERWLEVITGDPALRSFPLEILIVRPEITMPELENYLCRVFASARRVVSVINFPDFQPGRVGNRVICNRPHLIVRIPEVVPISLAMMPRDSFDFEVRIAPYQNSTTVKDFVRRSSRVEAMACAQYLEARRPDLYLLEVIAKFPGLRSLEYRELVKGDLKSVKFDREFGARFSRLWNAGWVESVPRLHDRFVLSEKGLGVLAAIEGKPVKDLQKCLGRTNQMSFFESQNTHLGATRKAVGLLRLGPALANWRYLRTRMTLEEVQLFRSRQVIKKIVIEPDSILAVEAEGHGTVWLYIELDRGSRHGKDLDEQLRKYMWLPFAYKRPCLPGPVLYVVDAGEESLRRLDFIARRIAALFKEREYSSQTHFLLVTLASLEQQIQGAWASETLVCHNKGTFRQTNLYHAVMGWLGAYRDHINGKP